MAQINSLKEWFGNIFQMGDLSEFNFLIFLFENVPTYFCIYDQKSQHNWFVVQENSEGFNQEGFVTYFQSLLKLLTKEQSQFSCTIIDDETNQIYEGFFPDYYLRVLALTYNIFYESCIFEFQVNQFKSFFESTVNQFTDVKLQRFLLTLISIDQVTQNMENEAIENCLTNFSESVFEDIISEGTCHFNRLIMEQEIPEHQVFEVTSEFLTKFSSEYREKNLSQKFKIFGYINLIDLNENKYVYYYQIEPQKNNMIVFRTINKRKYDRQILQLFQKKFQELGLDVMFYEDIPRHFMMNACPEIIMAIAINKLAESIQFEQILQIMSFNLIPCILDEEELMNFEKMNVIND